MAATSKTVFVLGAGFTKAFAPTAPLMVDHFPEIASLIGELPQKSRLRRILESEVGRRPDGRIDLERLMTRLDSGMPYDDSGTREESRSLLRRVKLVLTDRLQDAVNVKTDETELFRFAEHCRTFQIDCITFNYDDLLDRALWKSGNKTVVSSPIWWSPIGGYGFFCRPSSICIQDTVLTKNITALNLLKLHGSTNWRLRLGSPEPYALEDILCHSEWLYEDWLPGFIPNLPETDDCLEAEPFIVPPVLSKSTFIQQPILRHLWSKAYKILEEAQRVVFVGYSFPDTDLGTSVLFREPFQRSPEPEILVVNKAKTTGEQTSTIDRYKRYFPSLKDEHFDFRGGVDWCNDLVSGKVK
jgi:hypothetical protein